MKTDSGSPHANHHFSTLTIGAATAEKLLNFGIIADVVPKDFVAESLADALKPFVDGKRVLIARAEIARDGLAAFGAETGSFL